MSKRVTINIDQIRDLFENKGLSTYKVAEALNISQSYVSRVLRKWNQSHPNDKITIRSKSEAQKLHVEKNGHQREGTTHTEESKIKMSNNIGAFYASPEGDKAKKHLAEVRKEEWANLPEDGKQQIISDLRTASREAQKTGEGSKFENFIAEQLTNDGYQIEQRGRRSVAGTAMEIDIAIPAINLAIEIDGPTHFKNTYGAENLAKVQAKDNEKNLILTNSGWNVLRVQDDAGSLTRIRYIRVKDCIKSITGTGKVYTIKP